MVSVRPYERRTQLLRLLAEHGPLSAVGIRACLSPTIHPRQLRDVLRRLYMLEVLNRRHDRVSNRVFHQIGQNSRARERAGSILGVRPDILVQPQFRHAELLHSEDCAAWTELLRHLLPGAHVRRDFQFTAEEEARSALLMHGEQHELLPDVLITTAHESPSQRITVALEVERTVKSEARLLQKLKKYAERSRIDGLVYVCDWSNLQDKLMLIYQSKVVDRALRINHYGRNFFLFADGTTDHTRGEPAMFNSALESVSFRKWMSTLAATKGGGRFDSKFQCST